jgi:hypothetical protein
MGLVAVELTSADTLAATPVIAGRLHLLKGHGLGVPLHPVHRHGAPAARVGPLLARAARPAAAFVLELAVLQGTVGSDGLGRGKRGVSARRLVARLQVDEGRRTVVPVDGRVGARVVSWVTVTHIENWGNGNHAFCLRRGV